MTTLVPYSEPPIPRMALEIERLRQRLDAAETELKARADAPPAPMPLPGKLFAGVAGVATLALVVIAGSLVWQQVHPAAPAQPTIVVQAAPAVGQGATQGQSQAQLPQPSYQASAAPPAYRPPIALPPPGRPPSRW